MAKALFSNGFLDARIEFERAHGGRNVFALPRKLMAWMDACATIPELLQTFAHAPKGSPAYIHGMKKWQALVMDQLHVAKSTDELRRIAHAAPVGLAKDIAWLCVEDAVLQAKLAQKSRLTLTIPR